MNNCYNKSRRYVCKRKKTYMNTRKLFKPLFFAATFFVCCLFFNCDKVFAATTTTCSKEGGHCNICYEESCMHKSSGYCDECDESNCSHRNGWSYENVVYYFYDAGHRIQKDEDIEELELSGEVKKENIVAVEVNNVNDFKEMWNRMGVHNNNACYIRAVIIHMHGKAGENVMGSENGINNKGGLCITESDIQYLKDKHVQRLVLLTCYGAYRYFSDYDNLAKLFSSKIKEGEVIAGSAKVYSHELIKWQKYPEEYYIYYVAMQEAKVDYVYTPSITYNDGYNWILYKKERVTKVCSGDCYSIVALLSIGRTYEEEE